MNRKHISSDRPTVPASKGSAAAAHSMNAAHSAEAAHSTAAAHSTVLTRLLHQPLAVVSGVIFLAVVILCLLAPVLAPEGYNTFDIMHALETPSAAHPMGTDYFGRDLLARMLYGGQITLRITLIATLVSWLGIPLGMISGYYAGAADSVLSRVFDALSVLPPLLLIVLADTIFGYGSGEYQYALGVAYMPAIFRLSRTLTMTIAGREYIEASRALGVKSGTIITRHVLRNIAPELLTQMVTNFSDILLYSTIIGYLDMGVASPLPEWGVIVHDMFAYITTKPSLVILPSAVVSIMILSINLFGRGLRDAIAADHKVN